MESRKDFNRMNQSFEFETRIGYFLVVEIRSSPCRLEDIQSATIKFGAQFNANDLLQKQYILQRRAGTINILQYHDFLIATFPSALFSFFGILYRILEPAN